MPLSINQIVASSSTNMQVNTNADAIDIFDSHSSDSVIWLDPIETQSGYDSEQDIEVITIEDDEEDDADEQLNDASEDSAVYIETYRHDEMDNLEDELHVSSVDLEEVMPHSESIESTASTVDLKIEEYSPPQRMKRLPDTFSSIIGSSILPSSSLTLPKNITATITANNVIPYDKMPPELNHSSPEHENDHLHHDDHAQVMSKWTQKSSTAISTFRTKSSPSSSSSSSSGCSSDFDQAHSPEEDEVQHHHDNSPDSPDSGVSGSVNSADDLRHMEEDEEDNLNLEACSSNQVHESTFSDLQLKNLYTPLTSAELNLAEMKNKSKASTSRNYLFPTGDISPCTAAVDTNSIVIQLNANTKGKKSIARKQFCCKWLDCDWPGQYEELAEHVREIHVEFQPFLDSHGKVIKWSKRISQKHDDDDETPCNSEPEEEFEEEDEEMATDDDNQSVSSTSSCRITRRSSRGQGLFHYSPHKFDSHKLRQNACSSENQPESKYVCLWRGCRVFGKPSSSKQWLDQHVIQMHSGPKPFKCIVDSCGQRFKSQNSLERHVNTHFRATNGDGNSQRNSIDCCCQCSCHSCSHCDISTAQSNSYGTDYSDQIQASLRPDKNRCGSMDSGISLNPYSCSESSASSSSAGPSKTTAIVPSQGTENCHQSCCRLHESEFVYVPKLKKKLPNIAQFDMGYDFYDTYSVDAVFKKLRTRVYRSTGVKTSCNTLLRTPEGKYMPGPIKRYEDEVTDIESQSDSSDSEEEKDVPPKKAKKHVKSETKCEKVDIFESKLFAVETRQSHTRLESLVIAALQPDDGEPMVRLRWFPKGVLADEWIKKDDLEANRFRLIPRYKLPESFQQSRKLKRSHSSDSRTLADKKIKFY